MRLDTDTLAAAYEAADEIPDRGSFRTAKGVCGMMAYALAHGITTGVMGTGRLFDQLREEFGSTEYVAGFTCAWDGGKYDEAKVLKTYGPAGLMLYLDGREDGLAGLERMGLTTDTRELATV